jgi:hypothetical protein
MGGQRYLVFLDELCKHFSKTLAAVQWQAVSLTPLACGDQCSCNSQSVVSGINDNAHHWRPTEYR